MLSAQPKMTAAEFRQLPEGPPYFQLIEGQLIMSASPNRTHQRILGEMFVALRTHLILHPIGEVFLSPFDVYLNDENVFEPDLLYVSDENSKMVEESGVMGAPDLAIEILSPSTSKHDRQEKRRVYRQAGVKELWLIDPKPKKIEKYCFDQPGDQPTEVLGVNDTLTSKLLPGFGIKVGSLFPLT